jgi:DNA-binding protein HU-beta
MTKAELIKAISDDTEIHAAVVEKVMDGLARVTSKALGEGEELTIPGIMKLATRTRAARKGRNPGTVEAIDIAAKTVVTAKPVKALADHVA